MSVFEKMGNNLETTTYLLFLLPTSQVFGKIFGVVSEISCYDGRTYANTDLFYRSLWFSTGSNANISEVQEEDRGWGQETDGSDNVNGRKVN